MNTYATSATIITSECMVMVKFYPESNTETQLNLRGGGILYWYCNQHGLFKKKI